MPVRIFMPKILGLSAVFSSIYLVTDNKKNISLKLFDKYNLETRKTFSTLELMKIQTEELHKHFDKLYIKEVSERRFNKLFGISNNIVLLKDLNVMSRKIGKLNKIMRHYLNTTNDLIKENRFDVSGLNIDLNELIEEIMKIEHARLDFIAKGERNLFINSIFEGYQDTILRTFANIIIINKNNINSLLKEDNVEFILNYCRAFLKENKDDAKSLEAKRVLINYYTKKDYYYADCLLEVNHQTNFEDFIEGDNKPVVKTDNAFDYDIVFIHGLNVRDLF
jgi:hypothetical protein